MKRGNRNNSYERGGQIELAKAMGNVAKKGDKEINEGREEIKSIRKDITGSENQINNLESGIDREKKSIKDNENVIKDIKKDLGGIYKTVQDAKKQKAKFAKGGTIEERVYAIDMRADMYADEGFFTYNQFKRYADELSDDEFMDEAETQGLVWSSMDGYIMSNEYNEQGAVDNLVERQIPVKMMAAKEYVNPDFLEKGGSVKEKIEVGSIFSLLNHQTDEMVHIKIKEKYKDILGRDVVLSETIPFDMETGKKIKGKKGEELVMTESLLRDTLRKNDYKNYAKGGEVGKTYEIKGADVTFYEDSYEEGEQDQFHSYYLGENDFPYKTKFSNKKDLFITLNAFVSYAYMKEEDFYVDEDTIQTSVLVKHEKGSDWDEFSAPTEKEKELWKKGEMKLYSAQFVFPYEVYKKEKLEFEKGGQTDDVIMIKIGGDKKYPYYIKKIDTTHMSMANSKDGVDLVTPSHILQHRGESYYDDVRSWLKGGTSPNGKSYDSDYYAKGGKTDTRNILMRGKKVRIINTRNNNKEGYLVSNKLPNGKFKVILENGKLTSTSSDNIMLLSDKINFAKGGEVKKNEEHNTMLIGGIAGILLGIFLGRK